MLYWRSAYTLPEVIVVLVLMSLGTTCVWKMPIPNEWQRVEAAFETAFWDCRQTTNLKGQPIQLHFTNQSIQMAHYKIDLPKHWHVSPPDQLSLGPHGIAGKTISFQNIETHARRYLVFQVGGGTYDWR